ncbi:MAG: hypothetical protein FWB71_04735 [Defluviitaleaceae bacterium]|nr:hypothetical protein [Defluviitaleaceae bacterium]
MADLRHARPVFQNEILSPLNGTTIAQFDINNPSLPILNQILQYGDNLNAGKMNNLIFLENIIAWGGAKFRIDATNRRNITTTVFSIGEDGSEIVHLTNQVREITPGNWECIERIFDTVLNESSGETHHIQVQERRANMQINGRILEGEILME